MKDTYITFNSKNRIKKTQYSISENYNVDTINLTQDSNIVTINHPNHGFSKKIILNYKLIQIILTKLSIILSYLNYIIQNFMFTHITLTIEILLILIIIITLIYKIFNILKVLLTFKYYKMILSSKYNLIILCQQMVFQPLTHSLN